MAKLHIVSILDRSGSMRGTEVEVIGAYNSFVKDQLKITEENGIEATMSLFLFDDKYEETYFKCPINTVPELTSEVYFTRGMTALYDAIGKTITKFEGKKKVIFFIETDGFENASKEFNATTLKSLVEKKKSEGWDFNFVGADLDSVTVANVGSMMGIDKTMAFSKSADGYNTRNVNFSASTIAYANCTTVQDAST